jgi:hypothetical protein
VLFYCENAARIPEDLQLTYHYPEASQTLQISRLGQNFNNTVAVSLRGRRLVLKRYGHVPPRQLSTAPHDLIRSGTSFTSQQGLTWYSGCLPGCYSFTIRERIRAQRSGCSSISPLPGRPLQTTPRNNIRFDVWLHALHLLRATGAL